MKQFRILACASHPEMVNAYKLAASSFPDIILNVYVGDEKNICLYLQMLRSTAYDAVIVPEGMAAGAEKVTGVPVIEAELGPLDVLRTIRQAQQYQANIVLAVHERHHHMVSQVLDIMQIRYPVHAVTSEKEIRSLVRSLKGNSSILLIGDVPIAQEASKAGVSSILLSIGQDGIAKAFQRTIRTCSRFEMHQDRMNLFQILADKSPHNLAILDADQTILYSNAALHISNPASLLRLLQNYVPQTLEKGSVHLFKKVANISVEIIGKRVDFQGIPHVIYYYDKVYRNFQPVSVMWIENYDDREEYSHYFYNSPEYFSPLEKIMNSISSSMMPALIHGQPGTGRQYIARQIYWQSNASNAPFVFINCHNLNERLWADILADVNTPFYGTGYTLYFHDIHVLSSALQESLVDFITQTNLASRCRILSSSTRDLTALVSAELFSAELLRILSPYIVTIPPLSERLGELPAFCGIIMNYYNNKYSRQIIGFAQDTYPLLQHVTWHTNFDQLDRLIHQLVLSGHDSYISAREVKDCIEPLMTPVPVSSDHQISLAGTLNEIEARIISTVLAEEHMNQSAAAKRLGIGRTTLWRKLNT